MARDRIYPAGIQTFSNIIEQGMVYVDKTDLVYRMVKKYKYVFLGRPRRFGKSLLSSILLPFLILMVARKSWLTCRRVNIITKRFSTSCCH